MGGLLGRVGGLWALLEAIWRVLERSRAVLGGLEPVLVASGAVREPSEPRPGALWAPGTAMRHRGPGPGARPRQSRIYVYIP